MELYNEDDLNLEKKSKLPRIIGIIIILLTIIMVVIIFGIIYLRETVMKMQQNWKIYFILKKQRMGLNYIFQLEKLQNIFHMKIIEEIININLKMQPNAM